MWGYNVRIDCLRRGHGQCVMLVGVIGVFRRVVETLPEPVQATEWAKKLRDIGFRKSGRGRCLALVKCRLATV